MGFGAAYPVNEQRSSHVLHQPTDGILGDVGVRYVNEKGEDQQLWNALLGDVQGMEDVASRVQYQVPVPMKDKTKFLDAWIPISPPTNTAGNGIIYAMESKT